MEDMYVGYVAFLYSIMKNEFGDRTEMSDYDIQQKIGSYGFTALVTSELLEDTGDYDVYNDEKFYRLVKNTLEEE